MYPYVYLLSIKLSSTTFFFQVLLQLTGRRMLIIQPGMISMHTMETILKASCGLHSLILLLVLLSQRDCTELHHILSLLLSFFPYVIKIYPVNQFPCLGLPFLLFLVVGRICFYQITTRIQTTCTFLVDHI